MLDIMNKKRKNEKKRSADSAIVAAKRRMITGERTTIKALEITSIPILILILQFLDQHGLMKASTVSKQWYQIIHTNPGMAEHRIIPVLKISASKYKSDEGRSIRLLEWLGANLDKLGRNRVLQLLDVNKFDDADANAGIEEWFRRFPRFQLNGIVSLDVSSPMKLSDVDSRVLHQLSSRLPSLREIDLSNIGFDVDNVLSSFATHCSQLEKITWNNNQDWDDIAMCGFDMMKATNLREIMMDGSSFVIAHGDGGIDEISDLENHPRYFLFYRLMSQALERLSIRRAKFNTNNQLVPQNALIKYIRNAPPSLRWFRSDLSKENIEMLRLERPGIEFLN